MSKRITKEMLDRLRTEVVHLEENNTAEIKVFEKNLQELQVLYPIDDPNWSPHLDSVEIITIEQTPSLASSIHKITIS